MQIHTKTHQGLIRANNQDSLLVLKDAFGVADGMGGHKGGETASLVAVQVIKNALQGRSPEEGALKMAIEAANRRIFEMSRRDSTLTGMGTTLTMLWRDEKQILVGHVGDSRAYLFRDGVLSQQTEDHSMVAELLKNQLITPQMAETHPYRNVITRALGTNPMVQIDFLKIDKKPGDLWLICSDGLYNMVSDEHIAEVLTNLSGERAVEKLLELAIDHGGTDNVSIVLGQIAREEEA